MPLALALPFALVLLVLVLLSPWLKRHAFEHGRVYHDKRDVVLIPSASRGVFFRTRWSGRTTPWETCSRCSSRGRATWVWCGT